MELSIFEVLGPVMVGPSSSHTAGAARLARVAAIIAQKPFVRVRFGLSGSFAKTGRGHGTYEALLAGALGMPEDDERLPDAFAIARQRGVQAEYRVEDLDWLHENAVHITFYHTDGSESDVQGASVGGGRIRIRRIGRRHVDITAEAPTLVVNHMDRPGVVSQISRLLAKEEINIAVMRLSREGKGRDATLVIEVDGHIPPGVMQKVHEVQHVTGGILIDVS